MPLCDDIHEGVGHAGQSGPRTGRRRRVAQGRTVRTCTRRPAAGSRASRRCAAIAEPGHGGVHDDQRRLPRGSTAVTGSDHPRHHRQVRTCPDRRTSRAPATWVRASRRQTSPLRPRRRPRRRGTGFAHPSRRRRVSAVSRPAHTAAVIDPPDEARRCRIRRRRNASIVGDVADDRAAGDGLLDAARMHVAARGQPRVGEGHQVERGDIRTGSIAGPSAVPPPVALPTRRRRCGP